MIVFHHSVFTFAHITHFPLVSSFEMRTKSFDDVFNSWVATYRRHLNSVCEYVPLFFKISRNKLKILRSRILVYKCYSLFLRNGVFNPCSVFGANQVFKESNFCAPSQAIFALWVERHFNKILPTIAIFLNSINRSFFLLFPCYFILLFPC